MIGAVGTGDRFRGLLALLTPESEPVVWRPDRFRHDEALPEHVREVDVAEVGRATAIFVSCYASDMPAIARELGDHIDGRTAIIHTCRSLDHEGYRTMSAVLEEYTPTHRFGFLSGPMVRSEVEGGLGAGAVVATKYPEVAEIVEETLHSDRFRVYRSEDVVGCEIAATYGRALALAAGVGAGLRLGRSLRAILLARGLAEMSQAVAYLGGNASTAFGIAGAGNLFADGVEPGSADFLIGVAAVERGAFEASALSEAFGPRASDLVSVIETLSMALQESRLSLDILEACRAITAGTSHPLEAVRALMALSSRRDV